MKTATFPPVSTLKRRIPCYIIAAVLLLMPLFVSAQARQLSLADLIIGLRSQKVSLPERNRILAEAIKERGVTFELNAEIASELTAAGAHPDLLQAIRVKIEADKPAPTPEPTPVPTPTPPGYDFYQSRADASLVKGDFKSALADYDKAAELKKDEPTIFLSRGRAHFNLKSFDRSVSDFDQAIKLSPGEAIAYVNRGATFEALNQPDKAIADYRKALDLDSENETAKLNLKRLEDAAAAKAAAEAAKIAAAQPRPRPEFVNMGTLTPGNATRMTTPTYPSMAQRNRIEGRVAVEITIDVEGNVTEANAISGPAMLRAAAEEAAKRSKFRPAMFDAVPIIGKGVITYNFSL